MSPSSCAEIGCLGIVGLDVGPDVGGGIVEGVNPGVTTAAGGNGIGPGVIGFAGAVVTSLKFE